MAAQVRTKKGKAKPSLINKLELSGDTICSAVFIPHEDSIITVATDKYDFFYNYQSGKTMHKNKFLTCLLAFAA